MLNQAAPPLVAELAARVGGVPCWFGQVTEEYPDMPYILISDVADETPEDQDLSRGLDTINARIYVTVVDRTFGNVANTRAAVRVALGNGRGLDIATPEAHYYVKHVPAEGLPTREDRNEERDQLGRYPCFSVDAYAVHVTTIEEG